jgi:hypothetical protein
MPFSSSWMIVLIGSLVAIVDPRRTYAFARAIGKLAKTDEIDYACEICGGGPSRY